MLLLAKHQPKPPRCMATALHDGCSTVPPPQAPGPRGTNSIPVTAPSAPGSPGPQHPGGHVAAIKQGLDGSEQGWAQPHSTGQGLGTLL